MAFCLTSETKAAFKKALKNREVDPSKLSGMTSEERRGLLAKYVGEENVRQVNSLFESKLLLKNQKAGFITWAKKVSGLSKETRRDLISRIERMDKVLNPQEEMQFLEDLASARLGVGVTQEEAKRIFELSSKVSELTSKTDPTKSDINLGRAKLDLTDYVNSLGGKKADLITNIAGVPRSAMASLDLSAPLNQGWGMASRKQFYTSLGSMFKYAKSKEAFRDLQADIITRPNYDLARKSGLRLTDLGGKLELREEQFMSTLLDRVPGVAASQRAYTGFLNKLRFDVFDDLVKKAQVSGENVSLGSKAAEDIAKVVNNFTGGARVGRVEGAVPFLNAVFFSPRKIASTLQMMNPKNYVSPNISRTARLAATRNLIGSLSLSAGVISAYGLLTGRKQESNPTSTDFGKIRVGDTRLDVSGGNATYLTLLSRLVSGRIKSATGISRKLGTGFGETSAFDLIADFARYKLSPNASLLVDAVTGANAIGEKKTIGESVMDRFKPLFANSLIELLESDTDGKFGLAIAGLLGAGLNTYSNSTDWGESTGKELRQFRAKVGDEKFVQANEEFNKRYDEWQAKTITTDTYKKLSDEAKQKLITKSKEAIKQQVFKEYGFKYKAEEKTEEAREEEKVIESLTPKEKTSLIQRVNRVLSKARLVSEVSASGDDKELVSTRVEGETVIFTYKGENGEFSEVSKHIDKDIGFIGSTIGHLIDSLGRKLKLKEKNVSEFFGYEDKLKRLEKQYRFDSTKVVTTKKEEKRQEPEKKPETEDKPRGKVLGSTAPKTPYDDKISKVFGGDAENMKRVLSHPSGGENKSFNPEAVNINTNGSEDRGLYQINSDTFRDFMKRKGNLMKKKGINSYADMFDPEKNIEMAKIIFDEQGFGAWYGAPPDLR